MRVAAIDCGTNTIKLLIGDLPDVAVREARVVRLGQDVDRTGRLADEALGRAFAAIDEYAALVRAHGADRIRFCATSATRDSENAQVFSDGVFERLGVRPEVLTGAEEATLAYAGTVRHLTTAPAEPVLVIDVGGGSTGQASRARSPRSRRGFSTSRRTTATRSTSRSCASTTYMPWSSGSWRCRSPSAWSCPTFTPVAPTSSTPGR